MHSKSNYIIPLLFIFFLPGVLHAQIEAFYAPPHNELEWQTIETEHFFIHFHTGAERSSRTVAKIAEEIFHPIVDLYGYEPKQKMHFVIRDHDDYSNGAAYFYNNKIEILATSMDFELRGTHNWLRNVVTHEFIHMIQIQASQKLGNKVPAAYLQWIDYEDEKVRKDVLFGFIDKIVSFPVAFTVMPSWFAEGVAQYQITGLGYDNWDAHRDMMLRTAVLTDNLLSFSAMGSFGKNSIGNERAYNQGFAFVRYIVEKYGIKALARASRAMKSPLRFSFSSAIETAVGVSGTKLYQQWKDDLKTNYSKRTAAIRSTLQEGELVHETGIGNFYPVWSHDGKRLAYISTLKSDYLGRSALVIRELAGKKLKIIKMGAQLGFDWSQDNNRFIYAKKTDLSKNLSAFFDLYSFDLATKKETRLTTDLRAHSPAYSPDEKQIVFVQNGDGTQNLASMNLATKKITMLTPFSSGEQVFNPRWSPDGTKILFSYSEGEGRQIHELHLDSKKTSIIVDEGPDNRNARYAADGKSIYFSSNRTGIFNIYSRSLSPSEQAIPLTNVIGGAFMPHRSNTGTLAFSTFKVDGYKMAVLNSAARVETANMAYGGETAHQPGIEKGTTPWTASIENIRDGAYNDKDVPEPTSTPYKSAYSPINLAPRIVKDYGGIKAGAYFASSDVLEKFQMFGSAAVNKKFDFDLSTTLINNNFGPLLYLQGFSSGLHTETDTTRFRYIFGLVEGGHIFTLPKAPRHMFNLFASYSVAGANQKADFDFDGIITPGESFSYDYYIGRTIGLTYLYNGVAGAVDRDANPRAGRYLRLTYNRSWDLFINGFEVNKRFSTVQEVFDKVNHNRFQGEWREYLPLPKRGALMLKTNGAFIDRTVDSFFYSFAGGLTGIRGYPYYAIGGRKMLIGTAALRFPLFWNMDFGVGPVLLDKLYLGVFADYGNAFNGKLRLNKFKRTLGTQLRLDAFSFYGFPTKIFFDAAYGIDALKVEGLNLGKEWRYYFGITFGYFD